jgi:CRP-like cAMP-binding protein
MSDMAMMDQDEKLLQSALQELGFMQFIPPPLFEDLKLKFNKVTFESGDSVLKQGRSGGAFFILATGCVSVWAEKGAGEKVKVASINPTTYFGEIALLEGSERIATLIADDYVEVLVLGKKDFFDLLYSINAIKQKIEQKAEVRKKETDNKLLYSENGELKPLTPLKKPSLPQKGKAAKQATAEQVLDVGMLYKDEKEKAPEPAPSRASMASSGPVTIEIADNIFEAPAPSDISDNIYETPLSQAPLTLTADAPEEKKAGRKKVEISWGLGDETGELMSSDTADMLKKMTGDK